MRISAHLQTFLILVVISVLIWGLDSLHFLTLFKTGLSYLTNPISFGLYSTKQQVSNQLYFVFGARKAAQENKALQEQLGALLSENASLRTKLAETEAELIQQNSINPRTYNMIAARPIGLDRYLLIDKGEKDGIKLNQAVLFKDNFIGTVVRISGNGASVQLSTDPNSKLSAFASGQSGKAKGILLGQFGSEMLLDKILHGEPLEKGNLVYSEGLEAFLPRGLILGTVAEVLEQKDQVFKQAKVTSIFDIRDLDLVYVIIE